MAKHTEATFETALEISLTKEGGYKKRAPSKFDESLALFPDDVTGFLKGSQGKKWQSLETLLGDKTGKTVLDELHKELEVKGSLHVLRHGFKCYGKTFQMAYFRPNTSMNQKAADDYSKNRLTVTRQLAFISVLKKANGKNRKCILDVTLAVNGIPVVTAELKNQQTEQDVSDAVEQYKTDRDGRDLIFQFKKRALVHFALDPDDVWMCTELKGSESVFLPFNRGNENRAGNPHVEGKHRTHYLWEEVLQSDSLLEILQRFMHLEVKDRQIQTDKGVRKERRETMIFPRYHQLDAVRKLVGHARVEGSGHNYLIQHSAGSGKSNSIAWLAYRLASLHDSQDQKVFHSVIVVSDRNILDQQLQDTIYQFEHKTGMVEKIVKDTQQLATALSQGTPIVITTIQKFPFISQAISTLEKKGKEVKIDTAGKRFAVVVDEAHSSQSGETAGALRGMLNRDGIDAVVAEQLLDEEDDDMPDDSKIAVIRDKLKRARQPNLSFFAFTATPKYKTLALFDEPGPSGKSPFHEYTMRQAIEEDFIMDVLQNYTTYKRFLGLIKQIELDPDVPKKKAVKALLRYMELHPYNIEQVVSVIIEHFHHYVIHEMDGQAKAMVVTGSRLQAVKYKLAFDKYIKEHGYFEIRSLVAFSGTVEDPDLPGESYTEVSMNDGVSERELPEVFERKDYRVLLVAEKYQTGYDQPLLQTMYVVKRLAGVQAVQTLSRLNRVAPGKSRTFVLDFVNEEEEIYKAFKPYYETTPFGENADPHRLSALQHQLLQWAIFTQDDVDEFAKVWYSQERELFYSDHQLMNSILDAVVDRFRKKKEKEQEEFRGQLTGYRSLYAFLSQIIPYQDTQLEKLYTFVRNLLTKLPPPGGGRPFVLDDEVALRYYRMRQISEGSIDLSKGVAESLKGPTDLGTGKGRDREAPLSTIVERLNERFGTNFTDRDQLFFDQVRVSAQSNGDIIEAALANNYNDFVSFLGYKLDELFIGSMDGNEDIFKRIMNDSDFRSVAQAHLAQEIFNRIKKGNQPPSVR